MPNALKGIIPVMLTAFDNLGGIDWESQTRLTKWYLERGSESLFAVCQSSEMLHLDLDEREALARVTVEIVDGRVPVIASGHIGVTLDEQITELTQIAATGIDCLVFVTNRLDPENLGSKHLLDTVEILKRELPPELQLGLYECPAPFRRLLSDDEIAYFAQDSRFVILKDVSCDINTVRRRLELTKDSNLVISNANAAIAYEAMKSGARGFCGVFNNFHPDLYRWLQDEGAMHAELASELARFWSSPRQQRGWDTQSWPRPITNDWGQSNHHSQEPSPKTFSRSTGLWSLFFNKLKRVQSTTAEKFRY